MSKIGLNIGTHGKCCLNCIFSRDGFYNNFVMCEAYNFYPFIQLVCNKHRIWK